jgi:hypothetical protein
MHTHPWDTCSNCTTHNTTSCDWCTDPTHAAPNPTGEAQ